MCGSSPFEVEGFLVPLYVLPKVVQLLFMYLQSVEASLIDYFLPYTNIFWSYGWLSFSLSPLCNAAELGWSLVGYGYWLHAIIGR